MKNCDKVAGRSFWQQLGERMSVGDSRKKARRQVRRAEREEEELKGFWMAESTIWNLQ